MRSRFTRAAAPAATLDVARRNAERLGDEPAQRRIGLAFDRRRAHPRLEHRAAVGQALDALDGSRPPRGVSRTSTMTPSAACSPRSRQRAIARSEHVWAEM